MFLFFEIFLPYDLLSTRFANNLYACINGPICMNIYYRINFIISKLVRLGIEFNRCD